MKKVLITGANGFVGSFMVEEAIRRGYDVYAAMRAESSKANLEGLSPKFIDLPYADKNRMKKCLEIDQVQPILIICSNYAPESHCEPQISKF